MSYIKAKIAAFEAKANPPPPPVKPANLSQFNSTTATVTSAPTGPKTSSGKRGLGWPWDFTKELFSIYQPNIDSGKVTWLFNWELWRPDGIPSSVEWVPCVRTAEQVKDIDPFLTDIINGQSVKVSSFLGFNEPEIGDQANMSVEDAVRFWRESILPAKQKFGFRLGSPGMTSDVSKCKPWLNDFLGQLGDGNGIDFLVVHWYGPDFSGLKKYLEDMRQTYGLSIWLNEFACSRLGGESPTSEEVQNFLKAAIPWLDDCEWIERYAYFGHGQGQDVGDWVGPGSNFLENGTNHDDTNEKILSALGRLYCEA